MEETGQGLTQQEIWGNKSVWKALKFKVSIKMPLEKFCIISNKKNNKKFNNENTVILSLETSISILLEGQGK